MRLCHHRLCPGRRATLTQCPAAPFTGLTNLIWRYVGERFPQKVCHPQNAKRSVRRTQPFRVFTYASRCALELASSLSLRSASLRSGQKLLLGTSATPGTIASRYADSAACALRERSRLASSTSVVQHNLNLSHLLSPVIQMDSSIIESDTTPRSSKSDRIFRNGNTTSLQRKPRTPNEPRGNHTSGTRVASIYAITSTQMTWQRYDKRRRRDHALGHLTCGNLCGRNLCHTLGVVAGVMDSQVQHAVHLQDETALGDREQLAACLPYTPFDLLCVPYRDRLSRMAQRSTSRATSAILPLHPPPQTDPLEVGC